MIHKLIARPFSNEIALYKSFLQLATMLVTQISDVLISRLPICASVISHILCHL